MIGDTYNKSQISSYLIEDNCFYFFQFGASLHWICNPFHHITVNGRYAKMKYYRNIIYNFLNSFIIVQCLQIIQFHLKTATFFPTIFVSNLFCWSCCCCWFCWAMTYYTARHTAKREEKKERQANNSWKRQNLLLFYSQQTTQQHTWTSENVHCFAKFISQKHYLFQIIIIILTILSLHHIRKAEVN